VIILKSNTQPDNWAWDKNIEGIKFHLRKQKLENFLNWSTIRATMYVGDAPHVIGMYKQLQESGEWERWEKAVARTPIGNAPASKMFKNTDGSMIVNAYHLYTWERVSGCRIDEMESIVEFGGGYGALCLICHRLGFSGAYHMIDFDTMRVLSDYFLKGNKIHIVYELKKKLFDLMIAVHSIDEATAKDRDSFMEEYRAKHHLVGCAGTSTEFMRQMLPRSVQETNNSLTRYFIN